MRSALFILYITYSLGRSFFGITFWRKEAITLKQKNFKLSRGANHFSKIFIYGQTFVFPNKLTFKPKLFSLPLGYYVFFSLIHNLYGPLNLLYVPISPVFFSFSARRTCTLSLFFFFKKLERDYPFNTFDRAIYTYWFSISIVLIFNCKSYFPSRVMIKRFFFSKRKMETSLKENVVWKF